MGRGKSMGRIHLLHERAEVLRSTVAERIGEGSQSLCRSLLPDTPRRSPHVDASPRDTTEPLANYEPTADDLKVASNIFKQIVIDTIPAMIAKTLQHVEACGYDTVKWKHGVTLLHWAAGSGNLNLCKHVLRLGADPRARDHQSRTPIECAIAAGHTEVAETLHVAEMTAHKSTHLLLSPRSCECLELVKTKGWAHIKWAGNHTLLHVAARKGLAAICVHLVECGADVQQYDDAGRCALDHLCVVLPRQPPSIHRPSCGTLDMAALQNCGSSTTAIQHFELTPFDSSCGTSESSEHTDSPETRSPDSTLIWGEFDDADSLSPLSLPGASHWKPLGEFDDAASLSPPSSPAASRWKPLVPRLTLPCDSSNQMALPAPSSQAVSIDWESCRHRLGASAPDSTLSSSMRGTCSAPCLGSLAPSLAVISENVDNIIAETSEDPYLSDASPTFSSRIRFRSGGSLESVHLIDTDAPANIHLSLPRGPKVQHPFVQQLTEHLSQPLVQSSANLESCILRSRSQGGTPVIRSGSSPRPSIHGKAAGSACCTQRHVSRKLSPAVQPKLSRSQSGTPKSVYRNVSPQRLTSTPQRQGQGPSFDTTPRCRDPVLTQESKVMAMVGRFESKLSRSPSGTPKSLHREVSPRQLTPRLTPRLTEESKVMAMVQQMDRKSQMLSVPILKMERTPSLTSVKQGHVDQRWTPRAGDLGERRLARSPRVQPAEARWRFGGC